MDRANVNEIYYLNENNGRVWVISILIIMKS